MSASRLLVTAAVRLRVPRCVAMLITSLQLIQMVVGCFVNYTAYTFKRKGESPSQWVGRAYF